MKTIKLPTAGRDKMPKEIMMNLIKKINEKAIKNFCEEVEEINGKVYFLIDGVFEDSCVYYNKKLTVKKEYKKKYEDYKNFIKKTMLEYFEKIFCKVDLLSEYDDEFVAEIGEVLIRRKPQKIYIEVTYSQKEPYFGNEDSNRELKEFLLSKTEIEINIFSKKERIFDYSLDLFDEEDLKSSITTLFRRGVLRSNVDLMLDFKKEFGIRKGGIKVVGTGVPGFGYIGDSYYAYITQDSYKVGVDGRSPDINHNPEDPKLVVKHNKKFYKKCSLEEAENEDLVKNLKEKVLEFKNEVKEKFVEFETFEDLLSKKTLLEVTESLNKVLK